METRAPETSPDTFAGLHQMGGFLIIRYSIRLNDACTHSQTQRIAHKYYSHRPENSLK